MKPELTRSLSALPEAAEAAELLVPSLELEDVTAEATVSGPIVWCTFKNFLSVTFILELATTKSLHLFFFGGCCDFV